MIIYLFLFISVSGRNDWSELRNWITRASVFFFKKKWKLRSFFFLKKNEDEDYNTRVHFFLKKKTNAWLITRVVIFFFKKKWKLEWSTSDWSIDAYFSWKMKVHKKISRSQIYPFEEWPVVGQKRWNDPETKSSPTQRK